MKLLTFQLQGSEYLGALTDAGVVNLSAAAPGEIAFSSMQQFIEAGQPALDRAYALLASDPASTPSDQLDWLAPLPIPAQIRDCLGFEEHLKNAFESAIKLSAMAADDPVKAEQEFRASGRFTAPEGRVKLVLECSAIMQRSVTYRCYLCIYIGRVKMASRCLNSPELGGACMMLFLWLRRRLSYPLRYASLSSLR